MPQFDAAFYTSQIFWMLISFGLLFLWITFIIFTMFQDIFDARQLVIQKHLKQAETINQQAEALIQKTQEQHMMAEQKRSRTLSHARTVAQEDMQAALDKNQRVCNKKFKQAIAKLQTAEATISSAMNDWTDRMQKDIVLKMKPKRGAKCKP